MPRRFYRKKRKVSKGGKRKYSSRGKSTALTTYVRAPTPVAPRTICKMKYASIIKSTGATIDHLYNLNSTFDPDRTGTGHQPYGRDQYAALYNRYRVFAVRYAVTWSGVNYSGRGLIAWDNQAVTRTNATAWEESPKSRAGNYSVSRPLTMRGHISLNAVTGVTKAVYKADDRYQAVNNADPAEELILHVGATATDGTIPGDASVQMHVIMTYYVEWFDPYTLSQS